MLSYGHSLGRTSWYPWPSTITMWCKRRPRGRKDSNCRNSATGAARSSRWRPPRKSTWRLTRALRRTTSWLSSGRRISPLPLALLRKWFQFPLDWPRRLWNRVPKASTRIIRKHLKLRTICSKKWRNNRTSLMTVMSLMLKTWRRRNSKNISMLLLKCSLSSKKFIMGMTMLLKGNIKCPRKIRKKIVKFQLFFRPVSG